MNNRFQASGFRCPICGSDRFQPVVVKRPGRGDLYQTAFFECCGCSVMFRDRERFSRRGLEVVPDQT